MNSPMDDARQAQQANILGGLGQATAPPAPPNIENAINKAERLGDDIRACHELVDQIFNKINGPRPEKEAGLGADCPAGQLAQLHGSLDNDMRSVGILVKRLAELSETL